MATTEYESAPVGFFAFILKPGSSLNPAFLLAADCCFAALFFVFVWLAYLTKGNVHFFVLLIIELLLWASVKWQVLSVSSQHSLNSAHGRFVQELRRLSPQATEKKHQ
ncbi:hypothetical protein EDD15DRAFT_2567938 [Pisolithus albus]|nr:hypothetical protein EDD15DRAFT_2567938 [Pisolithus albus]